MLTSSAIPSWWVGLAGVVVGFLLGEGTRYAHYRWAIWRNRRIIRTELQTILAQLPQKQDILRQAIEHFKQQRFMPTLSVRTVTTGYRAVLDDIYPHLTLVERNCLHVIYERLRVADEQMDSLEESFIRAVREKIVSDPWVTYTGRLEELLESYSVVDSLARAYIANQPIDVFANAERNLMNHPTARLDFWIGKAAGALLLAFGLTASTILVLGTYRIVSEGDSPEIATIVLVVFLVAVALFCLAVGYRMFLNRPNKYGSILTPLGWNALGALFALLAIVGGITVLQFDQYRLIAGPALAGVFAVCCFYAGRHLKART